MRRRNLRQIARISYYEPDEPALDEYIFCDDCSDYVYEYCSIHGPLLILPDDKVPTHTNLPSYVPRAAITIPRVFLHIAPSIIPGAGLGIFATLTLPKGVRFGPYKGVRSDVDNKSLYSWQIFGKNGKPSHTVDASDGHSSNWMRYVNCARHWHEQNLVAFQYQGELYYRTIKIIPRNTELLVFYGCEYASLLGINLKLYNASRLFALRGQQAVKSLKSVIKRKFTAPLVNPQDDVSTAIENNVSPTENNRKTDNVFDQNMNIINDDKCKKDEKSNEITKLTLCSEEIGKYLPTIDVEQYVCDQCNEVFNTKANLIVHLTNKIKPVCKEKKSYCRNLSKTYNGTNKYFCSINFGSQVKKQLRTRTGEKPYKCNLCQYSAIKNSHLKAHIRTHTGEKPYKCHLCQYSATHKNSIKTHIRTHTGEKPYKCHLCQYSATTNSNLKTHIRTHTGEKPYKCNLCQYSATQKSRIKSHNISIHKLQINNKLLNSLN